MKRMKRALFISINSQATENDSVSRLLCLFVLFTNVVTKGTNAWKRTKEKGKANEMGELIELKQTCVPYFALI